MQVGGRTAFTALMGRIKRHPRGSRVREWWDAKVRSQEASVAQMLIIKQAKRTGSPNQTLQAAE